MDMGKYVAVGVLAVIVLAAATYDKPQTKAGDQSAQSSEGEPTEPVYAIDYEQIEAPAAIAPESSAILPAGQEPRLAQGEASSAITVIAQASQALEYTVKKGQTLSDVAGELLGDRGKWRQLYEQNKDRLPSPDQIRAGMKLVYEQRGASQSQPQPAAAPRESGATALPASAPRAGGQGYRVAKGDTLYSIAKKELGSGGRWKEIASLNGIEGGQVKVGQRLNLPAK